MHRWGFGCGKSSTALSILGLLGRQGRVTDGEILYQGQNLPDMQEKQLDAIRGSEISMVFQDIMYSLNPVFTIGNQLTESIRRHLHCRKAGARALAEELLARTGLPEPRALGDEIGLFDPYTVHPEVFPEEELLTRGVRIVRDEPCVMNRIVKMEVLNSQDTMNYALGRYTDREAMLLYNHLTRRTESNAVEYMIQR